MKKLLTAAHTSWSLPRQAPLRPEPFELAQPQPLIAPPDETWRDSDVPSLPPLAGGAVAKRLRGGSRRSGTLASLSESMGVSQWCV